MAKYMVWAGLILFCLYINLARIELPMKVTFILGFIVGVSSLALMQGIWKWIESTNTPLPHSEDKHG